MSKTGPCGALLLIIAAQSTTTSCVIPARPTAIATTASSDVSELWELPADISRRDLIYGIGGRALAPDASIAFTFVAEDKKGHSPGLDVRDRKGLIWSVKTGPEAQTELVVSRVLWAIGYHQPPTYYLSTWQMVGGPAGTRDAGRFRPDLPGVKVDGDWSWSKNPFVGTRAFRGLVVVNLLLNNWDWKTSNNKIYRSADGRVRYVVRDLGASLGKTSYPRYLKWLSMRGFGQGSRNNIEHFEQHGFIKEIDETSVRFHYNGLYDHVVDLVRPADVRWAAELLAQLTDAQWDDAFRAAHYPPDIRKRYIRKIKSKIAEGLAVS